MDIDNKIKYLIASIPYGVMVLVFMFISAKWGVGFHTLYVGFFIGLLFSVISESLMEAMGFDLNREFARWWRQRVR